MTVEQRLGEEQYCYLTTTGRGSGLPREIEIWFGARADTIYLLSGGGHNAHWVLNIIKDANVRVRINDEQFTGAARFLELGDEEQAVRRLLAAKYEDWREGRPLSAWARGALPVAIELASSG
ncbi:MAG: nitroreductase family deazaflavin-dependent oxidoreductase [Dehalococcoidia bacterium]